jgi:hypothetical protein
MSLWATETHEAIVVDGRTEVLGALPDWIT